MPDLRTVTIKLPWPVSTNAYLRHVELPVGKGLAPCPRCHKRPSRIATLISEPGREWLKAVGRILFAEGIPHMAGPLSVEIRLFPPDRRSIDVDNRNKPILDALKPRPKDADQLAWLFAEDDSQVERLLTIRERWIIPGGDCIVTVTQLPVAQGTFFDGE
jgi:Holliday junction resolvase RusA-like endonuclease